MLSTRRTPRQITEDAIAAGYVLVPIPPEVENHPAFQAMAVQQASVYEPIMVYQTLLAGVEDGTVPSLLKQLDHYFQVNPPPVPVIGQAQGISRSHDLGGGARAHFSYTNIFAPGQGYTQYFVEMSFSRNDQPVPQAIVLRGAVAPRGMPQLEETLEPFGSARSQYFVSVGDSFRVKIGNLVYPSFIVPLP